MRCSRTGRSWLAGNFTTLGGEPRTGLGRLNSDGTLDPAFNPGANIGICVAVQPDGNFLVGGSFTTLAGQPRNYLGRFNSDGTLDPTFNPGANNWVSVLLVQPAGKILVSGRFMTLAGQPRNYLGRLNGDGTIREVLVIDDSPNDLRLIEKILTERSKYKPFLAEGGMAGWEALLARQPEAIILDLFMPAAGRPA